MNSAETFTVDACRNAFGQRERAGVERALRGWRAATDLDAHPLFRELVDNSTRHWPEILRTAPAAAHPWYDHLATQATIETFAGFLNEESQMPAFVALLETLAADLAAVAPFAGEGPAAAIRRNLANEVYPRPHAELYRELVGHVFRRAEPRALAPRALLDATNLVFYYGYFLDPAFAIGALYATELFFPWRAERMGQGLRRLGLSEDEVVFMTIHVTADLEDAEEWLDHVVTPLVAADRTWAPAIAAGAALRLETARQYFDCLSEVETEKEKVCPKTRCSAG